MLNLTKVLQLTEKQKSIIKSFGTLTADHWKKNQTRLRKAIRDDLKTMQHDLCVYCGCRAWGAGDVEHIVNKATYPEFIFTPENLAYSCKICNQTYKGDTDIISSKSTTYTDCKFTIVHPYLDDVDHYFDTTKCRIQIKDGLNAVETTKATNTIALFHWKDSEVVEKRAQKFMAQLYEEEHGITVDSETIDDVLTYKPS